MDRWWRVDRAAAHRSGAAPGAGLLGALALAGLLSACGGGGSDGAPVAPTPPAANTAPVALQTRPVIGAAFRTLVLDGSGSSDADGDALSYQWALVSRPDNSAASLSATTGAKPVLTFDKSGTYRVQLTVNDGRLDSQVAVASINIDFLPRRLFALGDETSLITDSIDANGLHDGFKYSLNDRSTTVARGHCLRLPTFVQALAAHYAMAFAACNPDAVTPNAFMLAMAGATVEGASNGLAAQAARIPALDADDLVSVMIGANDLLALEADVAAGRLTASQAQAEASRLGAAVAEQVNALLAAGARALVFTVPDLGLTPWARAAELARPGAASLLSDLSNLFNGYLRTRIDARRFDGRNFGLILVDEAVQGVVAAPSGFQAYLDAPANVADVACTTASAVNCIAGTGVATTLVPGATARSHLWADDRHFGPGLHALIGQQLVDRLKNLPF